MQTVAVILPLFLLIGMGFVCVKSGLIGEQVIPGLGSIVFYFALPATIFSSLSGMDFTAEVDAYFILAYALASLTLMALGLLGYRLLLSNPLGMSSIKTLGMSLPNSAFIGYPLLVLAFPGEPVVIIFVMAVVVENTLIFPLSLLLLEAGAVGREASSPGRMLQKIALRLAKNPILISIALGMIASLLQPQWPAFIAKTLDMLTHASAPLALIYIGAALAVTPMKEHLQPILPVALGKLMLHPLLAFLVITLLPDFDPLLQQGLLVITAVPMMAIYPIIGSQYGFRGFCASTLVVTTFLAFFSLSLVLWLTQELLL